MSRFLFWLLLGVLVLPLGTILFSFLHIDLAVWQHLYSTVLPNYVLNSILLALGVGLGVGILGTALAWFLTYYRFPGSRWLTWLSILPLAIPAYIVAYTYTGLLDFSGPIQSVLRNIFELGYGDYWFPQVRSLGGAIIMLTLVLFPYVYLLARNSFTSIPRNLKEASDTLGLSQTAYFWRVAFPIVRPSIIAGVVLAMMEALADYGTVAFFSVPTFTTGIFRTWLGIGSQTTALQLAGLLTLFVFVCMYWEQTSRRKIVKETQVNQLSPVQLKGLRAWITLVFCSLPVLFGFMLPVGQLLYWTLIRGDWNLAEYWPLVWQTLLLAVSGAGITGVVAIFLSYVKRFYPNGVSNWTLHVASLGYALPGVVVAVGLLLPLGMFDRSVNNLTLKLFDYQPGLILSGTLFVVLMAYVIRFLAVGLQHVQSGLSGITQNMDNAAQSLGVSQPQTLVKVHLPLMKNSIIAAVLLVFVDIMKELPATLVLRPFNFNTLAVKAYEFAMDERLQQAALPSITIVLCGIIPVFLLINQIRRNEINHVNRN